VQKVVVLLVMVLAGCDLAPRPIVKWTPDKVTIGCPDGWVVEAEITEPYEDFLSRADAWHNWANYVVGSASCRKPFASERKTPQMGLECYVGKSRCYTAH
jgi:hypothetical protein